jgi:hypothetical protein
MTVARTSGIVGTLLALATTPGWAISPEEKCEAGKHKVAGQYALCRHKADAKAIKSETAPNYSRCDDKLIAKWGVLEQKAVRAGASCIDNLLETDVQDFITEQANAVALALQGAALPVCNALGTCGDGLVNAAGEHCDGADLDGYSCGSFGLAGALACDASCDFDASACFAFDCAAAGGTEVGPACWFYGTSGQDCNAVCAGAGLVYDDATRTFAGSDGSLANCDAVLTALSVQGVPSDVDASSDRSGGGRGCATFNAIGYCPQVSSPSLDTCWWRDVGPTLASAAHSSTERACACKP